MSVNLDFKDSIFFNEKLKEALLYQIKSYDTVSPLTKKEFKEIKTIYPGVVACLNKYNDKLCAETINQVIRKQYFESCVDFICGDYKDYIMSNFSKHRWFFPFSSKALPSTLIAKLKMLSELEFKLFILDFLKKGKINLNQKQVQFLLYFLELDVFYSSDNLCYGDNFKLFPLEKTNDFTNIEKREQPFNYYHMTCTSEFKKKYNIQKNEMYYNTSNGSLNRIIHSIKCIPGGEIISSNLSNKIDNYLWNQCKKEYPELYNIHKLHKITPVVLEYYDDMKDSLLKMFKIVEQMGKNFPEINQLRDDLNNFKCEHFVFDSNRSLFYINQKFVNEEIEKFNDFSTELDSEFELDKLFILYTSYNQFIYDPQSLEAQKIYLKNYFEPLYDAILEQNTLIINQKLKNMLYFYMNEIKKFTLNSNSIIGVKLENHFKKLKGNLLTLDVKEQFQLYFSRKKVRDEELLTLTEWFNLVEKMISKYNIENKGKYKQYILKSQKRGII